MAVMPSGFYSRFDPAKNYDKWLYRAGRVVQGAELNETQEASIDRMKRITDVLFKDGAVIRDAQIVIDPDTGLTTLGSGIIYARGAMRGVAPKQVTIPLVGSASIGVYLYDEVITESEDPALKDPAIEVRNNAEPGAARLRVSASWGMPGDGSPGEYYGVYTILNGVLQSTLPPPQIDAVAQAIARYDRDSTGGHYISEGFRVTQLADAGADQVFSLESGNARVNGRQILISHAQRIVYDPDVSLSLKQQVAEQKVAAGGNERVNLDRAPVHSIGQVLITAQKLVTTQLRGAVNGGTDLLPDSAIVSIVAVNYQGTWNGSAFTGGTTYTQGANASSGDYFKSGDGISWANSAGGTSEPPTGATYNVVYRYIFNATSTITAVNSTGFNVSGAVAGTNIQVTYFWKRPRIDRICLDQNGDVTWVKGTPNDVTPRPPVVPEGLLYLASVNHTWTTAQLTVGTSIIRARSVANDGTRVQTMQQLESLETKVDNLFAVVSEHHLKSEIAITDPTTKRGIFVDPFNNDDKRDLNVAQNAAVVSGALTLPAIGVTVLAFNLGGVQTLPLDWPNTYAIISQTLRTGCMLVNPYQNFDPLPIRCVIRPATDFWTATVDTWTSPRTVRFTTQREVIDRSQTNWGGAPVRQVGVTTQVLVSTSTELASTTTVEAEFLRTIRIDFDVYGMGAGEMLNTVKFDGITVTFQAP